MADKLRDEDWLVVRAAGSFGCADLVALKDGKRPLLVEVKSTISPYSHFLPADRERLRKAAELAGADATLAWWPSRGQLRYIPSYEWPGTQTCPNCGSESPAICDRGSLRHPWDPDPLAKCCRDEFHSVAA